MIEHRYVVWPTRSNVARERLDARAAAVGSKRARLAGPARGGRTADHGFVGQAPDRPRDAYDRNPARVHRRPGRGLRTAPRLACQRCRRKDQARGRDATQDGASHGSHPRRRGGVHLRRNARRTAPNLAIRLVVTRVTRRIASGSFVWSATASLRGGDEDGRPQPATRSDRGADHTHAERSPGDALRSGAHWAASTPTLTHRSPSLDVASRAPL